MCVCMYVLLLLLLCIIIIIIYDMNIFIPLLVRGKIYGNLACKETQSV